MTSVDPFAEPPAPEAAGRTTAGRSAVRTALTAMPAVVPTAQATPPERGADDAARANEHAGAPRRPEQQDTLQMMEPVGGAEPSSTMAGTDRVPREEVPPTLPDHTVPSTVPVADDSVEPGPLFVVGDVHGHREALVAALQQQDLIDAEEQWCGGRSRVWFLGDFTDRGPDGIGVIRLVDGLGAQAGASGGQARALLGNHELLLLGAHRFGDTPVNSAGGTASFLAAWRLNGGQQSDMDQLTDEHLNWITNLPALAVEDDYLLLHSDTTAYLEYGASVEEVHDQLRTVLHQGDAEQYWECFRRLTKRFGFRGDDGPDVCRRMLDAFGGSTVVHGHSPIPYLTGAVDNDEGDPGAEVTGPHVYADSLAVAMDGGVTMNGPMLVRRLPLSQPAPAAQPEREQSRPAG